MAQDSAFMTEYMGHMIRNPSANSTNGTRADLLRGNMSGIQVRPNTAKSVFIVDPKYSMQN